MRLFALGLVALAFAASSQAQQAVRPAPGSTYVVPSHRGEAVRITTYAQRPTGRGRLAARYAGIRANRSPRREGGVVARGRVAQRVYSSPRHSFVKRGGSFFQVLPQN